MATRQYAVYIENEANPDYKLTMVQFPSLKSQFDRDVNQLDLFVKAKSMKIKLDVSLSTNSKNFSNKRAELLAEKSKPQSVPNGKVEKNIYTSSKNEIDDPQLFICKIVGNKLVCRRLDEVLALRSDLTHFDLKEEVDPREEVKPVSVKFATSDRQFAPARPKETVKEMEEALEEFVPYKLENSVSDVAKLQREFLFGLIELDVKIKPDPDAVQCIPDQKPVTISNDVDIKPKIEMMDVDDIYASDIRSQPGSPRKSSITRTRVKECLMKAKLVSLEEVYRFLSDYHDLSNHTLHGAQMSINIKDIIDALNEHAVLVQGNWAVKSETLYGDSTARETTDVTGIPINLFTAARDYLLWLFDQHRWVSRPIYTKQVRLPDRDVLELFEQLGTFCGDLRKWELKLPRDEKFLEKFPEVVQRQSTLWKVRKANKMNLFFKS